MIFQNSARERPSLSEMFIMGLDCPNGPKVSIMGLDCPNGPNVSIMDLNCPNGPNVSIMDLACLNGPKVSIMGLACPNGPKVPIMSLACINVTSSVTFTDYFHSVISTILSPQGYIHRAELPLQCYLYSVTFIVLPLHFDLQFYLFS